MGFNKNRSFGGGGGGRDGRSFGGDRNRGGRDGDRPEMHKATCSDCGNTCEVPFRPSGDKPIYCDDCFRNKGGNKDRGDRGRRDTRPRFDNKRPQRNDGGNRGSENYKSQLEQLGAKLDKIIELLTPAVTEKIKEEAPEEANPKKMKKEAKAKAKAPKKTNTKAKPKKMAKKATKKVAKKKK